MSEEQIMHTVVWKAIAGVGAVAILGLGGLGIYAGHEHQAVDQLSTQLSTQKEQTSAALSSAQSQMDQLNNKVNALAEANAEAQAELAQATQQKATTNKTSARRTRAQDERLKMLQSQVDQQGVAIDQTRSDLAGTRNDLAGTQSQLDATRGDLSNTRTELTGSIARTHDELVLLEKKGERNYYEFDVAKSKQFETHGPVGIRLKKANVKHDYADLELMLDDRSLSQKHVNIYQPVMFHTPDAPQPIELVINSVTKNHIHGYVSSPKYRQSELAAVQPTNAVGATTAPAKDAANPADPGRQKLPAEQ